MTIPFSFLGSGVLASISDQNISDVQVDPILADAGYRIDADGIAYSTVAGVDTPIGGEWLVSGQNTDFEFRATLVSGTLTSGTTGSWLTTDSSRVFLVQASGVAKSCTFTAEIRRISDGVVLDTATIELYAESLP